MLQLSVHSPTCLYCNLTPGHLNFESTLCLKSLQIKPSWLFLNTQNVFPDSFSPSDTDPNKSPDNFCRITQSPPRVNNDFPGTSESFQCYRTTLTACERKLNDLQRFSPDEGLSHNSFAESEPLMAAPMLQILMIMFREPFANLYVLCVLEALNVQIFPTN